VIRKKTGKKVPRRTAKKAAVVTSRETSWVGNCETTSIAGATSSGVIETTGAERAERTAELVVDGIGAKAFTAANKRHTRVAIRADIDDMITGERTYEMKIYDIFQKKNV